LKGWGHPDKPQPNFDNIQPREVIVFHCVLIMDRLNFVERSMINTIKEPIGDFRDWDAITAWASTIVSR
jgi:menaquinone-dependent protoporphyrinogen IX oxidase